MNIPIKLKVSGHPKFTLTDIRDGSKQVIEKDNLLLDSFWDRYFTQSASFLSTTTMTTCLIGDGSVAPAVGDTGLSGATLASNSSPVTTKAAAVRDRDNVGITGEMPGWVYGVSFTPEGDFLAIGIRGTAQDVFIYRKNANGSFTQVTSLNVQASDVNAVKFSPDGVYLAVAHNDIPFLTIFKRDGEVFTKLDEPSISPTGHGFDVAWSTDGTHLSVAHTTSPFVSVYQRSDDVFTKLADPDILPGGNGKSVSWSPDGGHVAVGHSSGEFITLYQKAGESLIKMNGFDILPTGQVNSVSWSPDGGRFATGHVDAPFVTLYQKTGDSYTKLPEPLILPNGTLNAVAFSLCGEYLAVGSENLPNIRIYKSHENSFTALPQPDILPANRVLSLSWATGGYLAAGIYFHEPRLVIYKPITTTTQFSLARNWTFPAGVGTGLVSEVALRAGSTAAWNSAWVARIVLGTPLDKTEFHQLDVEWELKASYPTTASGVIPGGQIDGVTDIAWTFELNEKQLYWLMADNAKSAWFNIGNTPRVHTGTSNAPIGDLLFGNSLQGEEIGTIAVAGVRTVEAYVPGSLEREFRLFFEVDQMNGDIGEVVLEDTGGRYFGRITFDPPLDKPIAETHRLYLDVTLGMTRGV